MELSVEFLGGADTVTGSRSLITYGPHRFLVDCGLFQGTKEFRQRNRANLPVKIDSLEGVILTHAHLDHSGFIPRLAKDGYSGPVHMSHGTADLARIILKDAGYLEEEQAKYANQSGYSNHKPAYALFTMKDAEDSFKLFKIHPRHKWISLCDGLSFRFHRAGHIIGSCFVEFRAQLKNKSVTFTFSGDLGHHRSLTMKAPDRPPNSDVVILESTYGGRLHPQDDPVKELAKIVTATIERGGSIIIPSFAVGRAQDLIYLFNLMEKQKLIPRVPIILDSPMASEATKVFLRHQEDQKVDSAFSEEGFFPTHFRVTRDSHESAQLCRSRTPMLVISSSGMLSGGRILHHLKSRIEDKRNSIVFTGYQAEGTKGRYLQSLSQGSLIRIHHEEFEVNAELHILDALSAHGDYGEITNWLQEMPTPPKLVVLNHGSPTSQSSFADYLSNQFELPTTTAHKNGKIDLTKYGKK